MAMMRHATSVQERVIGMEEKVLGGDRTSIVLLLPKGSRAVNSTIVDLYLRRAGPCTQHSTTGRGAVRARYWMQTRIAARSQKPCRGRCRRAGEPSHRSDLGHETLDQSGYAGSE
jgi:hypothetical protein